MSINIIKNNGTYILTLLFKIRCLYDFSANFHIIIHDLQTERLTIINRSQSDGAEQPCDDADGGHLRFPSRFPPHIIRALRALEWAGTRKTHYVKPRVCAMSQDITSSVARLSYKGDAFVNARLSAARRCCRCQSTGEESRGNDCISVAICYA